MLRNNYYFTQGLQTISGTYQATYQYAASSFSWIKRNTIGDLYELSVYKQEFILHELVKRAEEGANIGIAYAGPAWYSGTPQIVVVIGNRQNLKQVTDYGEQNGDPDARIIFNIIDDLAGEKSIISLQGAFAREQKKLINQYLQRTAPIDNALRITDRRLNTIFDDWDQERSCEEYFSYLAANVIGESIMGVKELDIKYIPLIRRVSELVLQNNPNSDEFKRVKQSLNDISKELLDQFSADILKGNNFLYDQAGMAAMDSEEEKLNKLTKQNVAVVYIVESNLSASLMMALLQIHQHPEIKKRLIEELVEAEKAGAIDLKNVDSKMLSKLQFLDCVVKEVLRFLSPTGLMVRQTKFPTRLNIANKNNQEISYEIPARSRLFAPVSAIHQGSYWENPDEFNPDRFMPENASEEHKEHNIPFSTGGRSCPAANKFVPAVMKKFIFMILHYEFEFNSSLEQNHFPHIDVQPRWQKNHFLTAKPKKIAGDLKELDRPRAKVCLK